MCEFTYPTELEIVPLATTPNVMVSVPGSKSITNRALVLAALASREMECTVTGVLKSEDTEVMVECLNRLGYLLTCDWDRETIVIKRHHSRRLVPNDKAELYVANSGTTVRFVAAMVALSPGTYRFDGVERMRERPVQDLLDALNGIEGVRAESELRNGASPFVVTGTGWPRHANELTVRADKSSQFASALLMASAFRGDTDFYTHLYLKGSLVSEPYLSMTHDMMTKWGCCVLDYTDNEIPFFEIQAREIEKAPPTYAIEPDASSASYFFAAAAIVGGRVTVLGMKRNMLQGDVKFVDALEKMGCRVEEFVSGITIHSRPLKGLDLDMNAISDTVMTLAAVACFAEGPTTIRNVAHIRHKETDRIAAVATELRKLGAEVDEFADGLTITPRPMKGCAVETYNDHRMAMSLALIGLRVPGVVIKNPGCVAKTYPGFWKDFEKLRG